MKYSEINAIYTYKVAKYIAKGYTIRTEGMGGSQGQISAIHMDNGTDFIAIIMSSLYMFTEREGRFEDGIEIVVKSLPRPKYSHDTVWLDKGTVVEVNRYYEISEEYRYNRNGVIYTIPAWYTEDKEEYKRCKDIHYKRYSNRNKIKLSINYMKVGSKVMARVHSTRGCKNAKATDVQVTIRFDEYVTGNGRTGDHKYDKRYTVTCNGKTVM